MILSKAFDLASLRRMRWWTTISPRCGLGMDFESPNQVLTIPDSEGQKTQNNRICFLQKQVHDLFPEEYLEIMGERRRRLICLESVCIEG